MAFRTPTSAGLASPPNAAGDFNNPPAEDQELQVHRFWGRYALETDLPNNGTNAATDPAYSQMAPGDVGYNQDDACLYLLTDRGTLGGNDAVWVCLTPSAVVQTIRDAHVLVVADGQGGGYLPAAPAAGVANNANLPAGGPAPGGVGITADIIDPGDGTGLAEALSVAAALAAGKTGVDVRLRPCALTLSPVAIVGAGYSYPLVVGSPTAPVSLQGPIFGERNAIATITGPDGSDAATGNTQRIFELEDNSHLSNLSIVSPAADVAAAAGGAVRGLINVQGDGGGQAIRNCQVRLVANVNNPRPEAVGIWVYDDTADVIPPNVVIEDCDIRTDNAWSALGGVYSEAIRLGDPASASYNTPDFQDNDNFQRDAIRRCYFSGNRGVVAYNLYGLIVEDVRMRQTEGGFTDSAGVFPGVYWNLQVDPTEFLQPGSALELPRIKNVEYGWIASNTFPIPVPAHVWEAVLLEVSGTALQGGASGNIPVGVGAHIQDIRANFNAKGELDANLQRGAVRIEIGNNPGSAGLASPVKIEQCQITNVSVGSAGQAAFGTLTAIAGNLLVDGETFTISDGINTPIVFEFDSNGAVTPGNVPVVFTPADTAAVVMASMTTAINTHRASLAGEVPAAGPLLPFRVSARNDGVSVVTVTHVICGPVGNQTITDTVANVGFVVAGMTFGFSNYDYGIRLVSDSAADTDSPGPGSQIVDVRISDCNFRCADDIGIELRAHISPDGGETARIEDVGIHNVDCRGSSIGIDLNVDRVVDTIVLGNHLRDTPLPLDDDGTGTEAAHNII